MKTIDKHDDLSCLSLKIKADLYWKLSFEKLCLVPSYLTGGLENSPPGQLATTPSSPSPQMKLKLTSSTGGSENTESLWKLKQTSKSEATKHTFPRHPL